LKDGIAISGQQIKEGKYSTVEELAENGMLTYGGYFF